MMRMRWAKRIVIFSAFGFVFTNAFSQTNTPMLSLNTDMHTTKISRVSTDATGKNILTVSNDKTAKIWNAETGRLFRTLRIPIDAGNEGLLFGGAISPDGNVAAVGGFTGSKWDKTFSVYIFDVASGKMKKRIDSIPYAVNDIEFSQDGKWMAVALQSLYVKIYETETWSLKKSLDGYFHSCYNVAFDKNGRLATVCWDGKIRLYSNTFELIKKIPAKSSHPFSVSFSPDASLLAVGYEDSYQVQVLDANTLDVLYEPDLTDANTNAARFIMVSFSNDGQYLIGGGLNNKSIDGKSAYQIRVWSDKGKGKYTDFSAAGNVIMDIKPMPDNSIIFCGSNPDFGRMKPDGSFIFPSVTEINSFKSYGNTFTIKDLEHFKINEDGSVIGITPVGKQPLTFSVKERALTGSPFPGSSATDNFSGMSITDWAFSTSVKINSKLINFGKLTYSVDIAKDAKRFLFGTMWNIICTSEEGSTLWNAPIQSPAFCANISDNDQVVVAALGDGTLRWYNMRNGNLLFSLFIHPDNKRWVLWSEDGFFDCSAGAEGLIGWHVNQGPAQEALYYPAGQFFEKFYIPNLGARILAGEAIQSSDVSINNFKLPPAIKIISPENKSGLSSEQCSVTVEVTDMGGGIDDVLLYHNGKLAQTTERGVKLSSEKNAKQTKTFTISLINGENKIKATAFNSQRTEAIPDEIVVNYLGASAASNLYMLVIGIDNYKNPKYNLNYAVADAKGFKEKVELGSTTIFKSVKTVFISNAEATKQRILKEIEGIKTQVKQEDVFIFYYAGHGVMSDEAIPQFFIIPHDVTQLYGNEQMLKDNGISAGELKQFSLEIKAQKQMYILDACQSGGMLGMLASRGAAEEKAINQLARSTGTYWLAASNSEQFAGEFAQLGHGLFTYCILQGLSGKADGQNDKKITVQELSSYLNDQVPALSKQYKGSSQYPNTYGYGHDFPIVIIK